MAAKTIVAAAGGLLVGLAATGIAGGVALAVATAATSPPFPPASSQDRPRLGSRRRPACHPNPDLLSQPAGAVLLSSYAVALSASAVTAVRRRDLD